MWFPILEPFVSQHDGMMELSVCLGRNISFMFLLALPQKLLIRVFFLHCGNKLLLAQL